MPTYQYKCKNTECQVEFDVFYTSIPNAEREEPEEKCPKCDSKEKERLISRDTSFQLKGKGWYQDGYR